MMDTRKYNVGTSISPVAYCQKKLYTHVGRAGEGRLCRMLQSALNLENYSQYVSQDERNYAFLLITTEYSIDEVLPLIRNLDVDMGKLTLHVYNRGDYLRVSSLYDIINEVKTDNVDVLSLIIDSVTRLQPSIMRSVRELELQNVLSELKDIAKKKGSAVITSCQLGCGEIIDGFVSDTRLQVIKDISDEVIFSDE